MNDLELREAVAREVMGWTLLDRAELGWGPGPLVWATGEEFDEHGELPPDAKFGGPTYQNFRPESTWEGTGLVIERMRDLGWTNFALLTCAEGWYADFMRPLQATIRETADSAPRAVALAALASVRSEK